MRAGQRPGGKGCAITRFPAPTHRTVMAWRLCRLRKSSSDTDIRVALIAEVALILINRACEATFDTT
jgi:hypothetical protein